MLSRHLNTNRTILFDTSTINFSLTKCAPTSPCFPSIPGCSGPVIVRVGVRLIRSIGSFIPFFLKETIEPLAFFDQQEPNSFTNFSRSHSTTLLDANADVLHSNDSSNQTFEFFTLRDRSVPIPEMILQNVTELPQRQRHFHYHLISHPDLRPNLRYSIHLELSPVNANLSYLLIYKMNQTSPSTVHSIDDVHGWKVFCANESSPSTHHHMIDDFQQPMIYGIRQLNVDETEQLCSKRSEFSALKGSVSFTDNYYLRIYLSGCFYLDENYRWSSAGLKVCFSPVMNQRFSLIDIFRSDR